MFATDEAPLVAILLDPPSAAGVIRAAWEAGEAVLPLDPATPPGDLRRVTAQLRPTHFLDRDGRVTLPNGEPVHSDVAAVVRTSGTTGEPRGVELGRDGLIASARAVTQALEANTDDRWLCCLPVHHVAGLAILARSWVNGLGLDVLARFSVDAVDKALAVSARGTKPTALISVVPTMLQRLLDADVDCSRARRVLVGAAPLSEALAQRAREAGAPIVTTYGLTETWGGVVHDGHPLAGVELRLSDTNEILARGAMVMRGYRRDPVGTAAAFTSDGWLRTGDIGAVDSGGSWHVVDRLRDLITSGGINISPNEVEAVLVQHPAVADGAIAGRPDQEWGERVVAFIVPTDPTHPPDLDDLREFVRTTLGPAKAPKELCIVREIPRTPGGKTLRRLL